ncbi:MAG: hypothetical protein NTV70_13685 [Acidobacteria bacterium]|nr:hypothetical protein [Acidobacteriota bacterium]
MNNAIKVLIRRLVVMTGEGQVKWKPSVRPGAYATNFTDSSVEIRSTLPPDLVEGFVSLGLPAAPAEFRMFDSSGKVAGVVDSVSNPDVQDLWAAVRKTNPGPGEKIADSILAELDRRIAS